jgi:glycosyltransferase involved in cell wall biosynthesis/2-polyprenyl-3-methyl-5-hydroxy-6-metoxy-1,4-benzoquinol methylase
MSAAEAITEGLQEPARRAPTRILHVYSGNLYGGIETFLRMVGSQGLRVPDAITEFALCFEGRLASELRASGLRVHILGQARLRSPVTIVRVRKALAALLRSTPYGVVVCHSVWPHAIFGPVVRAAGLPLVHFMHDVPNRRAWPDVWAHRTPPDLVLCNSRFTLEAGHWLFDGVPRRLMVPWIEVDRFAAGRASRTMVRATFGVGDDTVVILQVSRFQESKGHRLLIDALGTLRDDPRWTSWITGKAQRPEEIAYERELRRRIDELGIAERIRFVGFYDDLPALMGGADLFCQPNVKPEPFGTAFVEALASSLPVVTTRMGGAVEIVTEECGRLVDPSPRAIGGALSRLIHDDDERARLSAAGPVRAREIGDPVARVRELVAVLSSAALPAAPDAAMISRAPAVGIHPSSAASAGPRSATATTRVLHLHSGNLQGGVETYLRTLAKCAALSPTVAMEFAVCFEGRLSRELREAGAVVHVLGPVRVRFPNRIVAARRRLDGILKARGFDVAVSHSVWAQAIFGPVVRRRGVCLAYHMHDLPNLGVWLDRLASGTSPDAVLCYSRYLADAGQAMYRGIPRHVVPPPSRGDLRGTARDREALRALLGARRDQVVILCASRLERWKGHALLLDALHELRDEPRWACWIAGGPQRKSENAYAASLQEAITRLGLGDRVQMLGQRTDVPDLMMAADIHCQPNTQPEPFGQVFVEALGSGLPIVTTDMGGGREIVTAECGVLVPPQAREVARALRSLVVDDVRRAALGRAAPARAQELCDPGEGMRRLAEVLSAMRPPAPGPIDVGARAALSEGRSSAPIISAVARALASRRPACGRIVDLGCGGGDVARQLSGTYRDYVGCDVVRYDGFPESDSIRFRAVDLNVTPYPLDSASTDVVVSVETIEHLENPRALVREMARIVRPGGWVVLTTPNQLSLVSKASLVGRNQFHAFQQAPGLYPAHITALVELDLRRIAGECGLVDVDVHYTDHGRVPFTTTHWPRRLGMKGQMFSDNVVLIARRP